MRVRLCYGDHGVLAEVPDHATLLRPRRVLPLARPAAAVRAALEPRLDALGLPARKRAGSRTVLSPATGRRGRRGGPALRAAGPRVAVVVSDVTRSIPNALILGPLLGSLEERGIARDSITLLVATGLHRRSRAEERLRIFGRQIASRYRIVDHVARERATLGHLCRSARGVEVAVCRDLLDAHLRILTGFVEPHLFAGFSGGGKAVLPGVAGVDAILANHAASMLADPRATWCCTGGNPIFEEIRSVGLAARPDLVVNLTLDAAGRLTSVFAGDLLSAHDAAIAQASRQAVRPIPSLFDIVVAGHLGYPADLLLYQSVKAMSVAARACRPGGVIVLAAECREGLGGAEYVRVLCGARSPAALLEGLLSAGETVVDQWQAQAQAMVQLRHQVYLFSALPPSDVEAAHLRPLADLGPSLGRLVASRRRLLGREPSVCVLPHGQLTVPAVAAGDEQGAGG